MENKNELKIILIFTLLYLALFTLLALWKENYEFLFYIFVLSSLILLVVLYHKKIHLSIMVISGLSILGLMHVSGGNIHLGGTRLYDIYLLGGILRYDQLVHTFGVFIATLVGYSMIKPYLDHRIKHHPLILSIILILIALGVGAINEIIEFMAVLFLGAEEAVGDYFNNAFDLVFNTIGSIIACFFIYNYHKKQIVAK
ncbi:DUF2238 domain-containing protein [Candidatus Woesearchaeota archaeon]|nr:DUF2238 domain-containing protein [Candidatus Woesearchaeota archaeon]